mgnify:CR=1 FL=1
MRVANVMFLQYAIWAVLGVALVLAASLLSHALAFAGADVGLFYPASALSDAAAQKGDMNGGGDGSNAAMMTMAAHARDPLTTSGGFFALFAAMLLVTSAHAVAMLRVSERIKQHAERYPQTGYAFW